MAVPIEMANELAALADGDSPEMVKIDAEGHDLRVLVRSSELLGKTAILVVKGKVCPCYDGSASEVIQCIAGAGY